MYGSTQLPLHCLAGVDRAGCELTAYLRLSAWSCISSTLYVFMTWRFIDVKDNFTIPLIQRFSTYGPRTTGGPRRWCRRSADIIKKYHKASGK
jgi:hypothetical protein